ncbi:hypothetical protein EGH21_00955 [Halomicroarcula sp. F13]|uniref:DUF7344 domain-containing protein n=1 Tax=Haloarcula rubra TaxID=2487747 RepID=A0AAW4PKI6_9EURY|nr:hypothetical protein [Halomicroarcula rubra]MBX0321587.1 hypothetical protein [Halomicroarcula rubra]
MSEVDVEPSRPQQGSADQPPSENTVFEILSNERRRFVFHYLKQQARRVYLRELAEHVAAWENEKAVGELTSAETKRVKTALHQHHLPKMDASGFVQYDNRRETVELADAVADLEVYLDVVPGVDVPWSRYYLALSTLGLVVVTAAWADLGPLGRVPDLSCALFLVVAVFVSAVVHTYLNHSQLRLGSTAEPPEVRER